MASGIKGIFSSVFLALFLFSASACAFTLSKDSKGNFLSWDIDSIPIRYWIHLENSSDKGAEEKVRAVLRAFESWEIKSLSLVSFRYAGLTDTGKAGLDGINLVTWITQDWAYNPETIAYTTLWITDDGRILDADIELNAEFFDWSVDGDMEQMDIHNVLTHEIGHFIGIEHSIESTSLSMFPIVSLGEVRKRVVKPDDIKAAAFLYPILSAGLEVFDLPAADLLSGFYLAERLPSNYSEISKTSKVLMAAGIRLNLQGDAGIAAMLSEEGKYSLGVYPAPGSINEEILIKAKDRWEIPEGFVKDFASIDLDGDGLDEIAVLSVDDLANQALYVFDSPQEGAFETEKPRKWIVRDLWRIPDSSDNLMLFSLDLDGDGWREIATLSYAVEGVYIIKSFSAPARFDASNDDALAHAEAMKIPFTVSGSILDIDSLDIDRDGISEAVALVKGDFGYTIQVYRISVPSFPDEVQEFKPVLTLSLVLEKDEHPISMSIINGIGNGKPEIVLIIGKSGR